jgi:hypothetical protein
LALLDKWAIAPRLEHHLRSKTRDDLWAEVAFCARILCKLRELQVEIDAMADFIGVPKVQLPSPEWLRPLSPAPE